jgi:hypothetical protein
MNLFCSSLGRSNRQLTALVDQCPHSAEGDMRALNEGAGFDPKRSLGMPKGHGAVGPV